MWLCGKPLTALNLSFSICHICHPFVVSAASDLWKETLQEQAEHLDLCELCDPGKVPPPIGASVFLTAK